MKIISNGYIIGYSKDKPNIKRIVCDWKWGKNICRDKVSWMSQVTFRVIVSSSFMSRGFNSPFLYLYVLHSNLGQKRDTTTNWAQGASAFLVHSDISCDKNEFELVAVWITTLWLWETSRLSHCGDDPNEAGKRWEKFNVEDGTVVLVRGSIPLPTKAWDWHVAVSAWSCHRQHYESQMLKLEALSPTLYNG